MRCAARAACPCAAAPCAQSAARAHRALGVPAARRTGERPAAAERPDSDPDRAEHRPRLYGINAERARADRQRDEADDRADRRSSTSITSAAMFTQNHYYAAPVDSQIGLVPGERMSVHDLLLALMLPSADDAAEDLAFNVGHGSIARFIGMMNARARELGLTHTHYSTPIGLDTPGNYSSASDLVKLASYALHAQPLLRADRRAAARRAAHRRPRPARRQPQRPGRPRAVDQRRQDGTHLRRRLRAGRVRRRSAG